MHATLSTNDARTLAAGASLAAVVAVSVHIREERIVLRGQCMNRVQARSPLAWYLFGRKLLDQFVHELLAEELL
jgi:hypothetical protein